MSQKAQVPEQMHTKPAPVQTTLAVQIDQTY